MEIEEIRNEVSDRVFCAYIERLVLEHSNKSPVFTQVVSVKDVNRVISEQIDTVVGYDVVGDNVVLRYTKKEVLDENQS